MICHKPFHLYITGGTATGKTTIAKELAKKLSIEYLAINTLILNKGLYLGYDINRDSVIIDEELLIPKIESIIDNTRCLCLEGGLIPLNKPFDIIVVLRCHIDVLRQRLSARNYSKEKVEENIQAEIMNVIYYDALELYQGQNIIEINNDEYSIEETCNQIISIARQYHPNLIEDIID